MGTSARTAKLRQEGRPGGKLGLRGAGQLLPVVFPLLLLFMHGVLYTPIGTVAAARGVDFGSVVKTSLDDSVPFVPVFVLAYLVVWILPVLLVGCAVFERGLDPAPYRRLSVFVLALMLGCYVLWILFPVSVDLRVDESLLGGYGWLGELVRVNYEGASRWNACPSFHVAGPWLLVRVLPPAGRLRLRCFQAAVASIMASTVLIRIHYLLDIAGGILMAELVYQLVRRGLAASGVRQPAA